MDCLDSGGGGGDHWGEAVDLSLLREQWDRMEGKLDRLMALSEGTPHGEVPRAAEAVKAATPRSSSSSQLCADHAGALTARAPDRDCCRESACPDARPASAEWWGSAALPSEHSTSPVGGTRGHRTGAVTSPSESRSTAGLVAPTLPLNWPEVLRIRPGFTNSSSFAASGRTRSRQSRQSGHSSTLYSDVWRISVKDSVGKFMIDPNSKFHMVYSFCSLLVLIYDLTLLPYVSAWNLQYTGWLQVSTLCTSAFWSVDILSNFMTGCYVDGELQMDFCSVARHYIRTWFVPDIVVVISDWVSFLVSELIGGPSGGRNFKMLRLMKLGRFLRVVGMIRMLRVVRILEDFAERSLSEGGRVAFHLVSLFSGIMWVVHVLSCVWFAVGKAGPSDTGTRWTDHLRVQIADGDTVGYLESGRLYQYAVAFHWAAGQIALGSLDVMPTNSLERLVFVSAMMVGFLFGSTLVSMLSAAMMDYRMMQKDKNMKLRTLRLYLQQNGVAPNVAMPVQKQAMQRLARRVCLEEKDVFALSLLSIALRSQLHFEIQRPHLLQHPVFRLVTSLDAELMLKTCMKAVSFTHLRPKDELFAAGALASSAYSLVKGELAYEQHCNSAPVEEETRTSVRPGSWLCEAALWTEWTHVGKAEATRTCCLLEINAEQLVECLNNGAVIRDLASEYCRHFHKRVTAAKPPHAPWPTDLEVPYTDYCDMVVCMSKEAQVAVGMDALNELAKSQRQSKAMDKLTEEVRTAKSILVVTGNGSITRVVSLVVLRLEDDDGNLLVQIGKWDGSQFEADCRLPGMKQEHGELVSETAARMLQTKMRFLSERVELDGFAREHRQRMSKEHGVQTRYLRSVCMARLSSNERSLDAHFLRANSRRVAASLSSSARDGGLLTVLLATDVLRVPSGADTALYAWLPPATFELLSGGGSSAEQALKAWLAALPRPEEPEARLQYEGGELVVLTI